MSSLGSYGVPGLAALLADWWGTDSQCYGWAAIGLGGSNLVFASGNPPFLLQDFLAFYPKFGTDTDTNAILAATLNLGGSGYTVNDLLTVVQPDINGKPAYLTVTAVNAGVITAFTIAAGGSFYAVQNGIAVTGGTGTGALINITAVQFSAVTTATLAGAGTGYTANDILALVQPGGSLCTIKVDTVTGGGAVGTFHIVSGGTGYSTATNLAVTGGTGTGATFNITAVTGYTGLLPQVVLQVYINLASAELQSQRWFEMWYKGMCDYVAHFATLYLRSEGSAGTTAQQVAVSGLEKGLTTSKSAGDVSMGLEMLAGFDEWGAWRETTYGMQLITAAQIVGIGPMYITG